MIFSRDLLFIHVPKAAGMAVTKYLLKVLPRPIYYSLPPHHEVIDEPGIIEVDGYRHETLAESKAIVERRGFPFDHIPRVFGVLRNPYALEVSRYAYLQNSHTWDEGRNQQLALEEDFETFAIESDNHSNDNSIQSYFEIDGVVPPNMRILHSELLDRELPQLLREAGLLVEEGFALPRDNESVHGAWQHYYSPRAEEAVYRRYQWVFDRGEYPRLDRNSFPFVAHSPFRGQPLPLSGPAWQVGMTNGFFDDLWAAPEANFRIKVSECVIGVVLTVLFPHEFTDGVELSVIIDAATVKQRFTGPGPFEFSMTMALEPGPSRLISIVASDAFCPSDLGTSEDPRKLSYHLTRIDCVPAGKTRALIPEILP